MLRRADVEQENPEQQNPEQQNPEEVNDSAEAARALFDTDDSDDSDDSDAEEDADEEDSDLGDEKESQQQFISKQSPFAEKHVVDTEVESVSYVELHQHFRPRAALRAGRWAAIPGRLHAYIFVACNAHVCLCAKTKVRAK